MGAGFGGYMRGHGDFGMCPEGVAFGQGFLAEHVQRGMGEVITVQRGDQGIVVNQGTAPGVDENGAFWHLSKAVCVEDMLRLRCL